ncbi:unnamed protein product [Rotaria magnacalcarata]|uniref:Uncharacterized protein n=1 Tax=Rotaria magnacalcarata TaxID=392030 RepID=A0A816M1G0_9BILA|nr:unnamed protein product [Rotaria magnacalcarata]
MSQLPMNSTCTFDYQCLTNISLSCSLSTNPSSSQCDNTVLLSCNTTTHACSCTESTHEWDGTQCVVRRSIGDECSSNYTDYWTGFLNNTYGVYCTPKINYGVTSFTCVSSSYQCRDYDYVKCVPGQCTCNSTYEYWDGIIYSCNATSMCRNWASVPNLQCLTPTSGSSIKQCLCNSTQYFDYCRDSCYTAQGLQAACNTTSCYAVSVCDQSKSLSCVNNICNCTLESCRAGQGTYLASCTTDQNYQCEEYNLLSCIASQCNCASVMYWSSSLNYCVAKSSYLGTYTSTSQCLTAAGVVLICTSDQCLCSTGYSWSSSLQQCVDL